MNTGASLPELNLPPVDLRLKREGGIVKVFDPLRHRYVALTPEEYVRQHFTRWLMTDRHYPASVMTNEVTLNVNGAIRRCDTLVFGRDGNPLVVVEYKAPSVTISQNTFDQIARYNIALQARYLIVSNGMVHYCCVFDPGADTYHFIPEIPDWGDVGFPGRLSVN